MKGKERGAAARERGARARERARNPALPALAHLVLCPLVFARRSREGERVRGAELLRRVRLGLGKGNA